jgi:gamma-glutamylaminecyclotransferase
VEHRVFVYGSLLAGEEHHDLLQRARMLGTGRTEPVYTLWDLGEYPALLAGGTTSVVGEIYAVDADLLAQLDEFEGHPALFKRETIVLADGTDAYAYLWQREPRGRAIQSGDYRERAR